MPNLKMSLTVKENPSALSEPLSKLQDAKDAYRLPENPLVVIEPGRGWIPVNLRDLWHYRDLLYILTTLPNGRYFNF